MGIHRKLLPTLMAVVALLVIPLTWSDANAAGRTTIRISAAISLKDALEAVKKIYVQREPGIDLQFNLASSGLLQRQIEEGAPVDLFISAGKKQMDELASKGLVIPGSRVDLLGNELVLIVAKEKHGQIRGFADLAKGANSFSIGQPETVPAGKYAMETLINLGLWSSLTSRIVFANDVRQVMTYVDSGNVDAGLVYRSDAVALRGAAIVAVAPAGSHSPIVYPMAAIKGGKNLAATKKFMDFLRTSQAARIFAGYRFIPLAVKR